ncbi:hypothetical protein OHS81_10565 [Streptomyces sp. NBC_00400]|uniref:hypothetical protein n=1 Tax=Streptomyces sp. NBC_00400 TaxID=2975737 RepID=UPI002E1ABF52
MAELVATSMDGTHLTALDSGGGPTLFLVHGGPPMPTRSLVGGGAARRARKALAAQDGCAAVERRGGVTDRQQPGR